MEVEPPVGFRGRGLGDADLTFANLTVIFACDFAHARTF